jgi:hypothetical protein
VKTGAAGLVAAVVLTAGCGGGVHGSAAVAGGIAGNWTQTITRAELLATHAPDYLQPKNLKLDVGQYRLVLLHGRARLSKHNPISTFHASGTFTVRGDTIAFRWTNAVENDAGSPPDPFCHGGLGCDPPWRLRWSLYRGVLTLRKVPSPGPFQVPPSMWAASWHRAGA